MSAKQSQNSPDDSGAVMPVETRSQASVAWDHERLDLAADQAIAACGGDLRSAIRALILANEFLRHEMHTQVSKDYKRGYDHGRFQTYSG